MSLRKNDRISTLQLNERMRVQKPDSLYIAKLHAFMADAMTDQGIDGTSAFNTSETAAMSAYICGKEALYQQYLKNEQLEPSQLPKPVAALGSKRHASGHDTMPIAAERALVTTEATPPQNANHVAPTTLDSFIFAPDRERVAANKSMPTKPYYLPNTQVRNA